MNSVHLLADGSDNGKQLEALVARKLPLIRRLARSAAQPGLDYDDAVQEGLIGLVSAVGTYSSDKSATLSTYADVCIRNAIVSAIRSASGKKNSFLNHYVSLDDTELSSAGCVQDALSYAELLSKIEDKLSNFERVVLRRRLAGLSYQEIAKALAVTQKSVDNALSRIRHKLKLVF